MRSLWNDDATDSLEYETMLRIVTAPIPDHTINWDAFHTHLSTRAELSLARLRHPRHVLTTTVTRQRTHA
jgi:hypothetical protein